MRRARSIRRTPPDKEIYCTECGVSLTNFCFDSGVDHLEAIRKTLRQCRKTGKARGEFCAKLFIAEPIDPSLLDDDPE